MNFEVLVHDFEGELIISAQFKDICQALDFFRKNLGMTVSLCDAETGALYVQRYKGEIVCNEFRVS